MVKWCIAALKTPQKTHATSTPSTSWNLRTPAGALTTGESLLELDAFVQFHLSLIFTLVRCFQQMAVTLACRGMNEIKS